MAQRKGADCNPTLKGDFTYETCAPFCSATSSTHCRYCKCKTCSFCHMDKKAATKATQQPQTAALTSEKKKSGTKSKKTSSSIGGTILKKKSDSASKQTAKTSAVERFDHYCQTAACEPFCAEEFKRHHCNDCKCKACGFCASYKCMEPQCEPWCDLAYKRYLAQTLPCLARHMQN